MQADGPTGWRPLRRGVWVDGALNDGKAESRGWGLEVAIPWSILGQVDGGSVVGPACGFEG